MTYYLRLSLENAFNVRELVGYPTLDRRLKEEHFNGLNKYEGKP